MAVTAFRSELVYKATSQDESNETERLSLLAKVQDAVFEYPGSKENHEWFLVKWVEAKFFAGRSGAERQ